MIAEPLSKIGHLLLSLPQHGEEIIHEAADSTLQMGSHAADSLTAMAGHAAEHGGGHPELPNWLEFAQKLFPGPVTDFLMHWQVVIFSVMVWVLLSYFCVLAYRKRALVPGKLQNLIEFIVEALANLIVGILGESGRRYVPFLGTLFVYIFTMNIFGLFPGMFSSTSQLNTTLALAICVFIYVQFEGIRAQGLLGYIFHFAGSPKSVVEWCLVPLNLPLHIIGELAKPISLSLRLFGNISGEDMLLAIFVGLGIAITAAFHPPAWMPGLPLHLPFIFLALLTSFVQALVFTLLSTIYFSLMTHHEEEEHH
jgi:F-type H+-transporting ATPase subunit a